VRRGVIQRERIGREGGSERKASHGRQDREGGLSSGLRREPCLSWEGERSRAKDPKGSNCARKRTCVQAAQAAGRRLNRS
jgi:hypothetical protein